MICYICKKNYTDIKLEQSIVNVFVIYKCKTPNFKIFYFIILQHDNEITNVITPNGDILLYKKQGYNNTKLQIIMRISHYK